jgi:coenzyme F420-0:L-glutamate ligase/coenzyme F420-1:gamma-L-glutamate ligase
MTTATESEGRSATLSLTAIPDIPEVRKGDRISTLLLDGLETAGINLLDGDIIAIAHKIISKAEGRLVDLDDVTPGSRAREIATITGKDPRLVHLILSESTGISRLRKGVLIVRHRLGFTSANAGIDRSNVPQNGVGDWVILLPIDPDSSAAQIGRDILDASGVRVGILIVDSHGRPFRLGTVGVAIGVSGIPALWDRRGESDLYGYQLEHTEVGTADEIAAAASILMGQAAEGQPAILIRGLQLPPLPGKAKDLVRSKEMDLYR